MSEQSLTLNNAGAFGMHPARHGRPRVDSVSALSKSGARVSRAGGAHFKKEAPATAGTVKHSASSAKSSGVKAKPTSPKPASPKKAPTNKVKSPASTTKSPATTAMAPKAVYVPNGKDYGVKGSGSDKTPKKKGNSKTPLIVCGVIAGIYLVGAITFSQVYMPGTKINGQDVSLKSPSAVAQEYEAASSSYALKVAGDNIDLTIPASDVNLQYNYASTLSSVDQGGAPFAWPVKVFTGNNLSVNFAPTYDQDKLQSLVQAAVDKANQGATQPTNATIAYNSSSKAYEVTPDQYGTAVDGQKTLDNVKAALDSSLTSLNLGEESLVAPTVLASDPKLASAADSANKMLNASQSLMVNGTESTKVAADQINTWVFLSDDLTPMVSLDAVKQWVNDTYAPTVNTVGGTRTYTTPYGKQVTVTGGTYGFNVDVDGLAQAIDNGVQSGNAGSIDVPFSSTAASYNPGSQDWGKRYIDIDITEQHARMYDDSGALIWESDIVSGNPLKGFDTPEGVYTINENKTRNTVLVGLDYNHDGEPDYKTPVSFWNPFIGNLVALHDAPTRGAFGGSIYKGRGSHGCVNLPVSKAKQLYELCQVGDVVVVHA